MNSQTLTATAAIAAAIISLINIAFTAFFGWRQENIKWIRNLLPELIGQFAETSFEAERTIFETDWTKLDKSEQGNLGPKRVREGYGAL